MYAMDSARFVASQYIEKGLPIGPGHIVGLGKRPFAFQLSRLTYYILNRLNIL